MFFRQVFKPDRRHLRHSEKLGTFDATVPGDDFIVEIDQNRIRETKYADALCNLADLMFSVRASISGVGL